MASSAVTVVFFFLLVACSVGASMSWTLRSDGLWQGTPSSPEQTVLGNASSPAASVTLPRNYSFRGLHLRWIRGGLSSAVYITPGHFGDISGSALSIVTSIKTTPLYPNATSDPRVQLSGWRYNISGVNLVNASTLDMFTAPTAIKAGTDILLSFRSTNYSLSIGAVVYEISVLVDTKPSLSRSPSGELSASHSISNRTLSITASTSASGHTTMGSGSQKTSASPSLRGSQSQTLLGSRSVTGPLSETETFNITESLSLTPTPTKSPSMTATLSDQTNMITKSQPSHTRSLLHSATKNPTTSSTRLRSVTPSLLRLTTLTHNATRRRLALSAHVSRSKSAAPSMSATASRTKSSIVVAAVSAPFTLLDPVAVTTASTTLSTGTAVVGALGAAPGAVLQAARALTVLSLSTCHFHHDASLSFPLSAWPGFGIGANPGAYYRGAVAANLVTIVACAVVGVVVSAAVGAYHGSRTNTTSALQEGFRRVRFPGVLIVPMGLLMNGLVATSLASVLHGNTPSLDYPLAAVGLTMATLMVACCGAVGVLVPTQYGMPTVATAVDAAPQKLTSPSPRACLRETFHWLFDTTGAAWEARPARSSDAQDPQLMLTAFGPVFNKYKCDSSWFYSFDLSMTVAVSLAQGVMPNDKLQCEIAIGCVTAPCLLAFVMTCWRRPDVIRVKLVFHVLSGGLTLASAVFVVVGVFADLDWSVSAGQTLAIAAAGVSLCSTVVGVCRTAWEHLFNPLRRKGKRHSPFADAMPLSVPTTVAFSSSIPLLAIDDLNHPAFDDSNSQQSPADHTQQRATTYAEASDGNSKGADAPIEVLLDDHPVPMSPEVTGVAETSSKPVMSSALLRIQRNAEGQRMHDEIEALLQHGLERRPTQSTSFQHKDGDFNPQADLLL